MKEITKKIGFSFIFVAVSIILAHNIIPHHHHLTSINQSSCQHNCHHHNEAIPNIDTSYNDNQNNDPLCGGCHFFVEATHSIAKISVDTFICNCSFCSTLIVPIIGKFVFSYKILLYQFLFISNPNSRGPPLA